MRITLYCLRFVLLLFIINTNLWAQSTIKGQFLGPLVINEVTLEKYDVSPVRMASVPVINNTFEMLVPESLTKGVYKLLYKTETSSVSGFDLIVDAQEQIDFTIVLSDSKFIPPTFTQSTQNIIWNNALNKISLFDQKLNTLKQAWYVYPEHTDEIVTQIETSIFRLIEDKTQEIHNLETSQPFVFSLLKNRKPIDRFNTDLPAELQDSFLIAHYWDGLDINQVELLNSPLLSNLTFEYINYFLQNGNRSKEEQDQTLKQAIDVVLNHATLTEVRNFMINYLTSGFKQLGNEDVLQYIDEHYSQVDHCSNPEELTRRLEGYKVIQIGNVVPDIIQDGENILRNANEQKTLIFFWASWCPHCMQEVFLLNELAKDKSVKVVAISLDTEKEEYMIVKEKLTGLSHYCDYKKWESKPVKDYFIQGTPTYFYIDKLGKLKGKYTSLEAVKQVLK